ncbi:hypothetical protein DL240_07485 [Lujinxingia litoralis]|uniref:Uncharacterized protein n=1 Tax=Lujinxingia litoralis TaxID=2211119 RepID=A0A328C852_9DELT|nr:hypothetical protein [Lujinxingia litoralis]RAL23983.1 hypothetical protein DL240_07485 [Lujinxingia litoralis]
MRPHLSADPTASVTADTVKKSGVPWFLLLSGCGCLLLVLVVLALAWAGYFFFNTNDMMGDHHGNHMHSEQADDQRGGLLGTLLAAVENLGDDNPKGAGVGINEQTGNTPTAADASTASDERTLEELFDALDTPISTSQARAYIAAMDDWANSNEVRQITEQLDTNQKLEEDGDGVLAGLKKMRAVKGTLDRSQALGVAFNKHIDAHGGRAFEERLLQFRLIHRVTSLGNKRNAGKEPWSESVADALLKDHDEQRPEFLKFRQIIVDAHKDAGFDPSKLSEEERKAYSDALANQFLLITGAINRDTLETWKALSTEERKEIHDQLNAPHHLISSSMAVVTGGERSGLLFYGFFGL